MKRAVNQLLRSLGVAGLTACTFSLNSAPSAAQEPAPGNREIQQPQSRALTTPMPAQPGTVKQVAPPQAANAPFPPLPPEHQQYLDKVLDKWTQETEKITRYRSDFQRWTFDGQPTHSQYAKGSVAYEKPDKGFFKVADLYFNKGKNANGAPQFGQVNGMFGEWWVCDGKTLHDFDQNSKP